MKYHFEVWAERHKTVEIEADNAEQAWDELYNQLYDINLDDAPESGDRRCELLPEEDEK